MPRKKREGEYGTLYAEIPVELLNWLVRTAEKEERTIRSLTERALQFYRKHKPEEVETRPARPHRKE